MAVDMETARQMALSLANTDEVPHFHLKALRVHQRIFATLWEKDDRIMVKLTPTDQSVFNAFDPDVFFPVPNKWGLQGCTFVVLAEVRPDMLQDALNLAYELAASKGKSKR